jgi:hypothetical protein
VSTTGSEGSGPETGRLSLRQRETGSAQRPLPPLPQYTCGSCGETFGSNCDQDDITCPYCEARRCPHCKRWFGSEYADDEPGTPEPAGDQVTVSREDLRRAVPRYDEDQLADLPPALRESLDRLRAAAGEPR